MKRVIWLVSAMLLGSCGGSEITDEQRHEACVAWASQDLRGQTSEDFVFLYVRCRKNFLEQIEGPSRTGVQTYQK